VGFQKSLFKNFNDLQTFFGQQLNKNINITYIITTLLKGSITIIFKIAMISQHIHCSYLGCLNNSVNLSKKNGGWGKKENTYGERKRVKDRN